MKRIKKVIQKLRFNVISWGINWNDPLLKMDIARWKEIMNIHNSDKDAAARLLWSYPEFRSLLLYREKKTANPFWIFWFRTLYKPLDSLFIYAEHIGGGLFIQHGFSTMISAKTIGENCWINQQVTIGYNGHGQPPVIGNNVMITCGAKVLGSIVVGDNSVIGANAVVTRDVEAGSVMGGIPAHKIK